MIEKTCIMEKFNKEEISNYKNTIKEALKVLDKKHLALIIHGASFPAICSELDTGIGSSNSEGTKKLINFIQDVFNSIQLGPGGKTKSVDSSPYTSTIFSNNPLFIDLHELTNPLWGSLLSKNTLSEIIKNNPNKDQNKVAYSYIFNKQEKALREAYSCFKNKLKNIKNIDKEEQTTITTLDKEFEIFIEQNQSWLEKDSLYEALSVKYANDYWPMWKDETDKNLFNPQNKEQTKLAKQRIKELKKDFAQEIDYYYFCQFIADRQKQAMLEYAEQRSIKLIADRQVAFSDRDWWANQNLFLKGWKLGCPPDYFSKNGQAWGLPVMDPEKLFNKNGSLGEGGKLLKFIFKKIFRENPGGVRIDHIIGLIDPWVYKEGKTPKIEQGAGRLFSSPEHPELAKYSIATIEDFEKKEDIDINSDSDIEIESKIKKLTTKQIHKYAAVIEKIIITSAIEEGLDKTSIICEDLGTVTFPVEQVMEKFELSGMSVTQFVDPEMPEHPYRGINTEPKTWIMVGTHDNEPITMWAKKLKNTHEAYLHAKNLANDLITEEDKKDDFIVSLTNNPEELINAKFAEIFASPAQNIQIFFTDFFGIDEIYNKPGTSGDKNWALRLNNNFEKLYYKQLQQNKGLNLAEILKRAILTKDQKFIHKNKQLIEKLDHYSKYLKNNTEIN